VKLANKPWACESFPRPAAPPRCRSSSLRRPAVLSDTGRPFVSPVRPQEIQIWPDSTSGSCVSARTSPLWGRAGWCPSVRRMIAQSWLFQQPRGVAASPCCLCLRLRLAADNMHISSDNRKSQRSRYWLQQYNGFYRPNLESKSGATSPQFWALVPLISDSFFPSILGIFPSRAVLSNLFDTAGHLVNFPPAGGPQSRGPWRARRAQAYKGVWRQSLQWGPGAEPLVGGSGERSPPEAETLFASECSMGPQICPFFWNLETQKTIKHCWILQVDFIWLITGPKLQFMWNYGGPHEIPSRAAGWTALL